MLADAMLNPYDSYESPISCLSRIPAATVRPQALHQPAPSMPATQQLPFDSIGGGCC